MKATPPHLLAALSWRPGSCGMTWCAGVHDKTIFTMSKIPFVTARFITAADEPKPHHRTCWQLSPARGAAVVLLQPRLQALHMEH
jgi:hypothetical protein